MRFMCDDDGLCVGLDFETSFTIHNTSKPNQFEMKSKSVCCGRTGARAKVRAKRKPSLDLRNVELLDDNQRRDARSEMATTFY